MIKFWLRNLARLNYGDMKKINGIAFISQMKANDANSYLINRNYQPHLPNQLKSAIVFLP